jgi:hypothetical protein
MPPKITDFARLLSANSLTMLGFLLHSSKQLSALLLNPFCFRGVWFAWQSVIKKNN